MAIEYEKVNSIFDNPQLNSKLLIASSMVEFAGDVVVNASFNELTDGADKSMKGMLKYGAFPYLWRKMAGVNFTDYKGRSAYKAFANTFELICRYDDMLDISGAELAPIDFKQDNYSKANLHELLCAVKKAPADKRLKNEFLSGLGNFRKVGYREYRNHELNPDADRGFEATKTYKELICGTNGVLAAKLCRLYSPETTDEVARSVESAFWYHSLYYQVGDDFRDMKDDDLNHSSNFVWASLSGNPDEETRVRNVLSTGAEFRLSDFAVLAPESSSLYCQALNEYHTELAKSSGHMLPFIDTIYSKFYTKVK